jgi:DNA-binding NtrC family response regulator
LSEDAALALLAHDWPGNVRELRNAIERAKLLARAQVVSAADLNLPAAPRGTLDGRGTVESGPSRRSMESAAVRPERDGDQPTRAAIEACLREAGGNISRAANSLGLSRQALYRRMQRFNLRTPGDA